MRVLALDPSGNFTSREGQGTTGWAFFDDDGNIKDFGRIYAGDCSTLENYWDAVSDIMWEKLHNEHEMHVVCESYKLQPSKAGAQSYSSLETPQLIGWLRMNAWEMGLKFVLQDPSIKQRFTDEVLVKTGVITKKSGKHYVNGKSSVIHERDAIRHGLYYLRYGKK